MSSFMIYANQTFLGHYETTERFIGSSINYITLAAPLMSTLQVMCAVPPVKV